jgi:uncharacterized protein (DUF302 family)
MESECKKVWEIAEGPSICLDDTTAKTEPLVAAVSSSRGMKIWVGKPFDDALAAAKKAIVDVGLDIVTEVDVRRLLHDRLGVPYPHYAILGIAKPAWIHAALDLERDLGTLIPFNLVVYEQNTGSVICAANPIESVEGVDIRSIADEAKKALSEIIERVSAA